MSSRTTATAVLRNFGLKNDEGEQIVYYRANDERDEAVFVASTIDNIVREKVKNFKDFAVLTVPMLSLVPLRKPCSSLIFHIQWLVGPKFYRP